MIIKSQTKKNPEGIMLGQLETPKSKQIPRRFKYILITSISLVILMILVVSIFISSNGANETIEISENIGLSNQELIRTVGDIFLLPDETPTIATVTDKNLLSEQAFFTEAIDGDKVLIFVESEIAILFRPDIGKIVNVSNVQLNVE